MKAVGSTGTGTRPVELLPAQLRYQTQMLRRRRARMARSWLGDWPSAAGHLLRFARYALRTTAGTSSDGDSGVGPWTGVLLSYKRPLNVDLIARSMLGCPGCEKLIISNNNPAVDLTDFITTRDQRVRIVQHARRRYAGIRLEIARASPARFYLTVDDDMFLDSHQIEFVMSHLIRDPTTPHGVFGELADASRKGYPYRLDCGGDGDVDHLTNVYAFTDDHLLRCYELLDLLGIDDVVCLANGEDLILSSAGRRRPRVHDVGPVLRCASTADVAVATCKSRPHFFQERMDLITSLSPARGW